MASDSRNQSPYFADGANTAACFILGGVFHHPRLEQAGGNRRAIMHQFDLKRTERAIERDLARGSLGDAGEENAVQ